MDSGEADRFQEPRRCNLDLRPANGDLILAWNNQERGRSPLHIARSIDGGKTWSPPVILESNPGEYPILPCFNPRME